MVVFTRRLIETICCQIRGLQRDHRRLGGVDRAFLRMTPAEIDPSHDRPGLARDRRRQRAPGSEAIVWALAAAALESVAPAMAMPSAAPSLFFMMPPFVRGGSMPARLSGALNPIGAILSI